MEAAYRLQITGEGTTYREQQNGRVQCRECGEEIAGVSLSGSQMTQHGQEAEARRSWKTSTTGEDPWTYCMTFPAKGGLWSFPVEGCPGRAAMRTVMRVHLLPWYVLDTVVVLEEGNLSHPQCPRCNMLVPRRALNGRHPATAQCAKEAEQRRRRLAEAELRENMERAFEAYGEPLEI